MLKLKIPGFREIILEHIVFDYNGTLAIDGKLIPGVRDWMNELSGQFCFHVITADTFGFVTSELEGVDCSVTIIPEAEQAACKLAFVTRLGREKTMSVGNGRNDRLMLKESALGVALLQEEGVFSETLMAADLVCRHARDVFAMLKEPKRLIASLRS